MKGLEERLIGQFGFSMAAAGIKPLELARHELGDAIFEKLKENYQEKERILGAETMRYHERMVMLSVIDGLWKDHLLAMDHLKEGIGLRGYAQQDPLVAYKRESFDMFEAMMLKFQEDTVRFLFRMQIIGPDGQPVTWRRSRAAQFPRRRRWPALLRGGMAGSPPMLEAAPREIPIPTRTPSTTIDQLEKEFARKKQRELAVASMAGGSNGGQTSQRRSRRKSWPQRSLPLRLGQEVQEVPRY